MSNYPDPCVECTHRQGNSCNMYRDCAKWLTRYRYRQRQINAYARKLKQQGVSFPPVILQNNPCETCRIAEYCDKICEARAAWWDQKMTILRKVLGYSGK